MLLWLLILTVLAEGGAAALPVNRTESIPQACYFSALPTCSVLGSFPGQESRYLSCWVCARCVCVCVCVCQVAVSCSATFQHLAPPLPGVSRGEGRKLISAILNFLATSSIHPSVPNTLKMVRIALPATTLPSIMDASIEEVTEGHSQISPSATDYLDATPTAATTGPSATSAARVARSTTEGLRSAPSTAGSTSSTPGEMHLETLEAPPPVVVDAVEPASFGDVFRATTASQVSTVVRVHLGNELFNCC